MVINTNIAAESSAAQLATSSANLAKSLQRLSSGSKIVSPQDDAAGFGGVLALMNRLCSVFQQVEQHLFQFVGNAGHRAKLRVELTSDGLALEVETDGEVEVIARDINRLLDQR